MSAWSETKTIKRTTRRLVGIRRGVTAQGGQLRSFVARAVFGKRHGPGQVGFAAITTAVEEAADAAEGEANHEAWRGEVGERQEWNAVLARKVQHTDGRADEAAVDDQPAFGKIKDLENCLLQIAASEALAPILDDVEQPRADDPAHDKPDRARQ